MEREQLYYLSENHYDIHIKNKLNTNKFSFWKELLGKEFLNKLLCSQQNLKAYFHDAEPEKIHPAETKMDEIFCFYGEFSMPPKRSMETQQVLKGFEDAMGDFYAFFLELSLAWSRRENYVDISENPVVCRACLGFILQRMMKIALRTLILCMHHEKAEGRLRGGNAREEYLYYRRNFLCREAYVREVCERYPVLLRSLLEVILWTEDYVQEAVTAFWKDRGRMNDRFFETCPANEIAELGGNMSDVHNYGRSVLRFRLDNGGAVLYKPHSLKNEIRYHEYVNELYRDMDLEPYTYKGIDRESYGWCFPVDHAPCGRQEEVGRYYRRLGIQLFACYVLNMSDMHFENLIACGEYPVIVDFETMLGQGDENVLGLGFLPCCFLGKKGVGVDISALNGRGGSPAPDKIPAAANAGTSDMHIVYIQPVLPPQRNLPQLGEKEISVQDYLEEICTGFRSAYFYAAAHREELKEKSFWFEGCTGRHLFRDTQQYAMLLKSSYHPDVMDECGKREILLMSLGADVDFENPAAAWAFAMERKAMLRGDIPIFYYDVDKTTLSDGDGGKYESFFQITALEKYRQRLDDLSEEDLRIQERLIRMSVELMAGKEEDLINSGDQELYSELTAAERHCISEKEILQAASLVGERILGQAVYEKDGSIIWFNALLTGAGERVWSIQKADYQLYNGLSGIAIFLHALEGCCPDERYAAACEKLDAQLFAYTDREGWTNKKEVCTGAYTGESSVVYAYQLMYRITGETVYLAYAKKHCRALDTFIEQDENYDVVAGNAGAILIYLNMEKLTQDTAYLEKAERAALWLMRHAATQSKGIGWITPHEKKALAGYAHGNAGIVSAFGALYARTGKEVYLQAVREALYYENSLYDEELKNWLDCRTNNLDIELPKHSGVAWCHGSPGVLLSRLEAERQFPREALKIGRDIELAADSVKRAPFRRGHCLCHGNCGNVEILRQYLKTREDEKLEMLCSNYVAYLTDAILREEEIFMPQEKTPGLMNGLAGIGYFLLEQAEELPCVLTLSI